MAKNKQSQPRRQQSRRARPVRQRRRRRSEVMAAMQAYDRLVRDPCGAPFASPPYPGGGSGYLARFTFNLAPRFFTSTGTVGSSTVGNFAYQIQPSQLPYYVFAGSTGGTTTPTFGGTNVTGSFLSSSVLRGYRPVAACAKWVPTGAIANRAGMIAVGYEGGFTKIGGDSGTPADIAALAAGLLERAPNGSSAHEVRWLPTSYDETYGIGSPNVVYGSGTIYVAGVNVDCVYDTTTTLTANGYVELTIVVEWIPAVSSGLAVAPEAPPAFTSQQYQSTIKDIGSFLLTGARTLGSAFGGSIARGAAQTVYQSISALSSSRRPALSLITG